MVALEQSPHYSAEITGKTCNKQRLDPAELAESHLRSNSYLALKNISCEYQEGVLILKGYLPTYYLKQVAQAVVAPTEGVDRILNQIEVVAPR
ncbi:MAG TPA: BON domain-containing protein [Gemmataceae bacterium]|jgi:osmotically-inducible protein OsmY|nr:BON domain-containing protein [Gemmataceae bacterium]